MSNFRITTSEVTIREYWVEAETEAEARRMVVEGDGVDSSFLGVEDVEIIDVMADDA